MPRDGQQVALLRRDGLITAHEFGEAVGTSLGTLHKAIAAEQLPGRRVGYRWYVDLPAVLALREGPYAYDAETSIGKKLLALARTVGRNAPEWVPPADRKPPKRQKSLARS